MRLINVFMQPCTSKDTKHASPGLCEGIERSFATFLLGRMAAARMQQTAKVGKGSGAIPRPGSKQTQPLRRGQSAPESIPSYFR